MRIIAILILALATYFGSAQKATTPEYLVENSDRHIKLNSIFPIDNIAMIKITNNYGTRFLTEKELLNLKKQLKQAKFAGGLLIKPGHILFDIKLKNNSIIKPGCVYGSVGEIHFESGVNKFNKRFSGTFILPEKINFDNFK